MGNRIEAIIFDQDLTLINSYPTIQQVAQRVARDCFPLVDADKIPDRVTELWGLPGDQFYIEMFDITEEQLPEIYEKIRTIAGDYKLETFDGTVPAVKKLSDRYTLGILTSAGKILSKRSVKGRGFDLEDFSFYFTADDTKFHKPDPRAFDELLYQLENELGIDRKNAIYVGDALYDGEAATGAGLNFVGVETGFTTGEEFSKNGYESIPLIKDLQEYLNEKFG